MMDNAQHSAFSRDAGVDMGNCPTNGASHGHAIGNIVDGMLGRIRRGACLLHLAVDPARLAPDY